MNVRKALVPAIAALTVMAFTQGPAVADERAGNGSLATSLLESRAQVRILRHDDRVHGGCPEKAFDGVSLVKAPSKGRNTRKAEVVVETKWQEDWSLDRCGEKVRYRVFFTDVGDAGAYFAFKLLN